MIRSGEVHQGARHARKRGRLERKCKRWYDALEHCDMRIGEALGTRRQP